MFISIPYSIYTLRILLEGFTIRICAYKYLWEGLIIVVNMMKSYRITYSIYIYMYSIICRRINAVWCYGVVVIIISRDDIRSRITSVGNRWLVSLEYGGVE